VEEPLRAGANRELPAFAIIFGLTPKIRQKLSLTLPDNVSYPSSSIKNIQQ
jgi:hypothetical protein